jgi:hypothetical protein
MTENDIDAALAAEERTLLASMGPEPGFIGEALGLFSGPGSWVNWLLMLVQAASFIASVWAGWQFFAATDVLSALHWGLPAATLLLLSLIVKLSMNPMMQANRVLRELHRLELRLHQRR